MRKIPRLGLARVFSHRAHRNRELEQQRQRRQRKRHLKLNKGQCSDDEEMYQKRYYSCIEFASESHSLENCLRGLFRRFSYLICSRPCLMQKLSANRCFGLKIDQLACSLPADIVFFICFSRAARQIGDICTAQGIWHSKQTFLPALSLGRFPRRRQPTRTNRKL